MERKFRTQKRTILILAIVCLLIIAAIVILQINIKNVKANTEEDMLAQVATLTSERDAKQAEFDAKDYPGTITAKKDEIESLKDTKEQLLATPTPEPTTEPTPEPTAVPTVEPTAEATAEATAAPTAD